MNARRGRAWTAVEAQLVSVRRGPERHRLVLNQIDKIHAAHLLAITYVGYAHLPRRNACDGRRRHSLVAVETEPHPNEEG